MLELDVSDDDPAAAAERVVDWLASTGGLTWPWGLPADEAIAEA